MEIRLTPAEVAVPQHAIVGERHAAANVKAIDR